MHAWFLDAVGGPSATAHVAKLFVALSTNEKAVTVFGIAKKNHIRLLRLDPRPLQPLERDRPLDRARDWVHELRGPFPQCDMGTHFRRAPLRGGLAVLIVVIGLWYNDFYGARALPFPCFSRG